MAFGTIAVSIGSTTDAMEAVKSCGSYAHGHNAIYGAVLSCITSIQTLQGSGCQAEISESCYQSLY